MGVDCTCQISCFPCKLQVLMTWFAVNLMATCCQLCLHCVQLASFRSCKWKSLKEHLFELLEKQWEMRRKNTGAIQSLIGPIFTRTVQIKIYMTIIHVPSELQGFCRESLFRGNKTKWLHD